MRKYGNRTLAKLGVSRTKYVNVDIYHDTADLFTQELHRIVQEHAVPLDQITLRVDSYDNSIVAEICVEKSDEELAQEVQDAKRRLAIRDADDRRVYEHLKKKFDKTGK